MATEKKPNEQRDLMTTCPLCAKTVWRDAIATHLLTRHSAQSDSLPNGVLPAREVVVTCVCGREFLDQPGEAMSALNQHLHTISLDELREHVAASAMADGGFNIRRSDGRRLNG